MIPDQLIDKAKGIARGESEGTGLPVWEVVGLSNEKGQALAEALGADKRIVLLGTILMDAWLGKAVAEGKQPEHAEFCARKAGKLLESFPEVTKEERENILSCIREHHGGVKFSSKESEICCNADCYRFASARGMFATIAGIRPMPLSLLQKLCLAKLEEKWKAISLPQVRTELEPEYLAIREFLSAIDFSRDSC
ncbi:MAG: hypothetical protein V1820_06565 [archaeon]